MHQVLLSDSTYICSGRLQGRLYAVHDYPGAVLSRRPDAWVHGEIYQMHDPARLLERLDRYEGCSEDAPRPHEYRREIQAILLPEGTFRSVWVYLYNRDTSGLSAIPSGYFLERPQTTESKQQQRDG
jgi:gamma-glutamylcyclotransferase (GGCT)/AIG2-like uncharacterized protein YtfP